LVPLSKVSQDVRLNGHSVRAATLRNRRRSGRDPPLIIGNALQPKPPCQPSAVGMVCGVSTVVIVIASIAQSYLRNRRVIKRLGQSPR
jgi:hypothetical protein